MSAGEQSPLVSAANGVNGVLLASVMTTISAVYPAFLAGALGPELRSALSISEGYFGFVIGAFFVGSTVGSVGFGRLGERLGARRMITVSLLTTAMTTAYVAAFVRSGGALVLALGVAGLANSGSQTAANKLLSQSIDPRRLGFAMAVKQSGMPGATLLGGLAVPAIALTVGWQWAYAAASALAVVALVVVLTFAPNDGPSTQLAKTPESRELVSDRRTLQMAAVAAFFAATAAGTLGSWLTSSAADAGWSTGAAGVLLSVGSVSGIVSRLILGWRADRSARAPMLTASRFLLIGACGVLILAPRQAWPHAIGAVVAFGAGWSWPALFNFSVVRTNLGAAARATGVTQTGVYIGVVTGPIAMGQLVERSGYTLGWAMVAVSMAIGASIMFRIADQF